MGFIQPPKTLPTFLAVNYIKVDSVLSHHPPPNIPVRVEPKHKQATPGDGSAMPHASAQAKCWAQWGAGVALGEGCRFSLERSRAAKRCLTPSRGWGAHNSNHKILTQDEILRSNRGRAFWFFPGEGQGPRTHLYLLFRSASDSGWRNTATPSWDFFLHDDNLKRNYHKNSGKCN